jgi:23S rRNA (uracil-5-)-methyltransferase RumA
VLLGIYRPGTHSVAPAHGCAVHHRQLQPVLAGLRALVEQLRIPVFDERTRQGALRYALARTSVARGETHLTLISAVDDPPRLGELVARMRRAHPELKALFLCVNPTPGNALLSADVRRLFGPPTLAERFADLELESRTDAFVQANPAVAAKIYAEARRWIAPQAHESAVDLFSGVGAIALSLAPRVARVVGIEAAPPAVECARANAARNGARNARFVAADAAQVAEVLRAEGLERPDLAVVNPPRRGLGAELARTVAALGASRLLYVSCDPRTLARDLAELVGCGFAVKKVRAFDMMPQTPHVEVMALLARA